MAVTVTNNVVTALNTNKAITVNAATSTVVGGPEVFTLTPTKSSGKLALLFVEGSTAATGKCSYSIAAGDIGFASKAITGTFGSTAAAGSLDVLQIDTAHVLQSDGTIAITVSPGDTTAAMLLGTHAMKLYAISLL